MGNKNTQTIVSPTIDDAIKAVKDYNQLSGRTKVNIGLIAAAISMGYVRVQDGDRAAAAESATEVEGLLKQMGNFGKGPFGKKVRVYLRDLRAGKRDYEIESGDYFEEFV
ncbi:MAG: hypothetical protein NTX24_04645 [Candidatus Pacearchaeota archaeon]|nr:hypothetical protein [Candidatus Pacearchaeota archaeon]